MSCLCSEYLIWTGSRGFSMHPNPVSTQTDSHKKKKLFALNVIPKKLIKQLGLCVQLLSMRKVRRKETTVFLHLQYRVSWMMLRSCHKLLIPWFKLNLHIPFWGQGRAGLKSLYTDVVRGNAWCLPFSHERKSSLFPLPFPCPSLMKLWEKSGKLPPPRFSHNPLKQCAGPFWGHRLT